MQKFSSFGRKKKKQTKIRHRMVMLEGLQLYAEGILPCSNKVIYLSVPRNIICCCLINVSKYQHCIGSLQSCVVLVKWLLV